MSYVQLHMTFLIYALSLMCMKYAWNFQYTSISFYLCFSFSFVLLFIYAFYWQKVLMKFSLSEAYIHKSVMIIYGFLIGFFLFHERITFQMLIGSLCILYGIIIMVRGDQA